MQLPDGFEQLLALVKKSPVAKATGQEIWNRFVRTIMIGKNRSDAEISFLMSMLKDKLDYDYVLKTNGEDWREDMNKFLNERMQRIQDEDMLLIVSEFQKGLFYFSASLKGGARFFKAKNLPESIDKLTKTKESTWELIKEIVESKDVSGIRYAKAILWLHYTGRGQDFAPPTVQLKGFINNDVGPYYQFYEDDDYFMKKAQELAASIKGATLMDIYRTIFLYRTFKHMAGRGRKMTPKKVVDIMKRRKLTAARVFEILSDIEERAKLAETVGIG